MATAGLPSSRLKLSEFCAPISTRATSLTRSSEPSGLARTTMLPNSSGVVSRPLVCTLNWNCCWSLIGCAPMRPTGACTFCDSMALMISEGAMPRLLRCCTSNQMRIEYFSLPNSEA